MSSVDPATMPRIRVIGTGPVALAFGLFALRRGVPAARIALDADRTPLPARLAARTVAISHGTRQLLDRVIRFPDAGTIGVIDVSMPGHAGRTRIRASDFDVPALGYVVRYAALLDALREAADRHRWDDAQGPQADAVVHAEGDPGVDARTRDFEQWALLTEVEAERPGHVAYERFTRNGPLALLPQAEPRRYAVVWCDRLVESERRSKLPTPDLAAELRECFGTLLGRLQIVAPVTLVPLVRRSRESTASGDEVWIGNAAQALHPVAGQGLNLGLRDAYELATILAGEMRSGRPPRFAFGRFARGRRNDRSLTIALTDLMAASFTWPLARPLQSPLLALLDAVPALRRPLAERLMFGWR